MSVIVLGELPGNFWLDTHMRKIITCAALIAALAGAAFAQVGASSSVYFLDVDPARYAGPAGQRLAVQVGDEPRHIAIGEQDEICVQLQRSPDSDAITARVRALRPEAHDLAVVKVAGTGISPGTYRSTPWGMLLRVVPNDHVESDTVKTLGTQNAPVCQL